MYIQPNEIGTQKDITKKKKVVGRHYRFSEDDFTQIVTSQHSIQ